MSGRMNWCRISERDRMRKRGVEDINGATALHVPRFEQPRPKYRLPPTKAELRKQAAAAFLQWRARQITGQP
jgi:hypothetical protein